MGNEELAQSLPCKEEEDEVNLLNHCHGEKTKDEIQGRKPCLGFGATGRVCNFFRRPFPDASSLPNPVVNALRRATEATTPCFGPKYRKIGDRGIFAAFPAGKQETSDFFAKSTEVLHRKYGGLCPRSPMFLALKHGIFFEFFAAFFSFLPRNPRNSADIDTYR